MPAESSEGLIDFNDDESRMEYGSWAAAYDLALALARARQTSECSQAELAEKLGTSQAYVAKLESGEANPTIRKVGAILGAMWLRLEMRPVPLRYYQNEHSAFLDLSAKSLCTTGITGEIGWRPVDIRVSPRPGFITVTHAVKGGAYIVCR